ncbi:nucleotidyltransferase family protein [Sporomusa sphaeroides]|uniref:nucleotidyltransferase family protein n=1 Tax=Sporomusa sphaeroides TaxID=47679 RepID=UPI003DA14B8E
MIPVGAVILAAGTASRMGKQKLLLPLAGKPLLAHVLGTVHSLPWAASLAVIGEPKGELAELCRQYQVRSVFNANRHSGQASSLVLALQMLPPQLAGIMFFLGDQPLVSCALIEAILAKFRQAASDKAIVVPCCQGQRYSPVLFGSHWRDGLSALTGDTGGRQLMRNNPEWISEVDWPEPACFLDADTWEEYMKLKTLTEG